MMEFHVSRQARDRYAFDQSFFTLSGNVIFANLRASRAFAQKMNEKRDLANFPERAVRAGQLNALGLIDEILHYVVGLYRRERSPQVMAQALERLKQTVGKREVENTLVMFASEFPPLVVYRGEQSLAEYYEGTTEGIPNEQILLEEMLMLWVANKNPAAEGFRELFDDVRLSSETAYQRVIVELHSFFDEQPPFGPDQLNLVDMLRSPAIEVPHSLTGQLEYIRERWSELLGAYLRRLLSSLDLIREEDLARGGGFMEPATVAVPVYDLSQRELEAENFSPDREWMPRLVMIAKNTYVWLDQLSRQYQRSITRLDQIPDEELERLARAGFTGLWLIGLWERSRASAEIKRMMGNPDAIASAYSLYDYTIAGDLGGEDAYRGLRDKAWRFGIRLASDMVPNHMGIDSEWVAQHPDWFVQVDHSPYPTYSFNGPNLSGRDWITVQLEDHYFDRTDAAVVFKLTENHSGRERYIYHGNDGTSMPWNDTAQLNYLKSEVREAVIQTILNVARRFPIIRFDAAMTLAKMHYQRLWFPPPGMGGAIPSRSEYSITQEQFDALMPVEFWREVVDRVAQEVPDTLLLAEAFWLMESYFVRTLGMHRVYNSAFMNLLRNEENAKYRLLMKNTLEFDPEILKRYVNFMNNPDERTAVDQFGKGDKYFGICLLMATLPGLPMFGHGQIEGFSEKYGMEFRRALWDETPDQELIDRHAREIFPLLHRRALFANMENFLLYDFFTPEGSVNEDVYAFSNGQGNERGLVVYHNKYASTRGWIRNSVGYTVKSPNGERFIIQRTLGEGLNLHYEPNAFCIYRDSITGLEYIRPSREIIEQGMYLTLEAYQYHAFLDFREVMDDEWGSYRRLNEYLGGRGVASVEVALQELLLQPVLQPFGKIVNPGYFRYLYDARLLEAGDAVPAGLLGEARQKMDYLMDGIARVAGRVDGREVLQRELRTSLRLVLSIPTLEEYYPVPGSSKYNRAVAYLKSFLVKDDIRYWALLFGWLFTHDLGKLSQADDFELVTIGWVEEWHFSRVFRETARDLGLDQAAVEEISALLKILITHQCWFENMGSQSIRAVLEKWLSEYDIQQYLNLNRYQGELWFNKERFETLVWGLVLVSVFQQLSTGKASTSLFVERLLLAYEYARQLLDAEEKSEFKIAKLLKVLGKS